MKKENIFLFFLFCRICDCTGQLTFERSYGGPGNDFGTSVINANDSGFIICGSYSSSLYTIRLKENGDTLWTNLISNGNHFYPGKVQQTSDSSIIILSRTGVYGEFATTKLSTYGNPVWIKTIDPTATGSAYVSSIIETSDRKYLIAGTAARGAENFSIAKLDTSGDTLWTRTYGNFNIDIYCTSVVETEDSGLLFCGFSKYGPHSILLIRSNSLGDTLWCKTYDGNHDPIIQKSNDHGFILSGNKNIQLSSSQVSNGFLCKIDSIGGITWNKSFGDTLHSMFVYDIIQTSDRGYSLTGFYGNTSRTDVFLLKTDSIGNFIWARTYGNGGYCSGRNLIQSSDGGYLITGDFDNNGNHDLYVIKTDSLGNTSCTDMNLSLAESFDTLHEIPFNIINFLYGASTIIPMWYNSSGGFIQDICQLAGINKPGMQQNTFSIFPNPANDFLNFRLEGLEITSISIFNLLGENVLAIQPQTLNNKPETELDVSSLPPGLYFLQATTAEGIATAKFIKE